MAILDEETTVVVVWSGLLKSDSEGWAKALE